MRPKPVIRIKSPAFKPFPVAVIVAFGVTVQAVIAFLHHSQCLNKSLVPWKEVVCVDIFSPRI